MKYGNLSVEKAESGGLAIRNQRAEEELGQFRRILSGK
jgi:hypothetical protein